MDERHEKEACDGIFAVSSDIVTFDYPKDVLLVDEDGYLHSKRCLTAEDYDAFHAEVSGKR